MTRFHTARTTLRGSACRSMAARLRRDRRGGAAIEFSIICLLMMVWIFGMMEVARAFWTYQIMQEVAIQGARCMGILSSSCASGGTYSSSAATSYIITTASELGLTLTSSNIALARPASCASTSGFSSVTINYTFTATVPLMVPSLSSIALSAKSCYYNVS